MPDTVHEVNAARHAERPATDYPPLHPGARVWWVPIRWWEPQDYSPALHVVDHYAPEPDRPRVWSVLAYSYAYGHNVWLHPADLFATPEDARAEMAERTCQMQAIEQAEIDRIVARIWAARG